MKNMKCKTDPEKKRKFNAWAIEKSFTQEIGSNPATTGWNNESKFFNEISNEKKNMILPTTKSLWFSQYKEYVENETFAGDKIKKSKGLIYINDHSSKTYV